MSINNPFRHRKAVTSPSDFCDRHTIIDHTLQKLSDGETVALSGEPRIGKTSLFYFINHPDGARQRDNVKHLFSDVDLFVPVDLQHLPARNALSLWRYVFTRILSQVEAILNGPPELHSKFRCYMDDLSVTDVDIALYEIQMKLEEYLSLLPGKVILTFDEFEVIVNDFDANDAALVCDRLRALTQNPLLEHKLNYLILSKTPLPELMTKRGVNDSSPLSNITHIDFLGLMEEDGAKELIMKPLIAAQLELDDMEKVIWETLKFSTADQAFVIEYAGRYPELLKITSYYLFQYKLLHNGRNVEFNEVEKLIERDIHARGLLQLLWERTVDAQNTAGYPLLKTLLSIARGEVPSDNTSVTTLADRGLLVRDRLSPGFRIFGKAFKNYVLNTVAKSSDSVATDGVINQLEDKTAELTKLESKLLQYLRKDFQQIHSHAEIIKAVWGTSHEVSEDALQQLVKRVRGKIEKDPKYPRYLLTVRGQGYLLKDFDG